MPLKHLSLLTYFLTYEDGGDYFSSRIETPKAGYPSPCAAAGRLWPSSHSLGHLSQTRLGSLPYDRAILSPECHRGTSGRVLAPRIECSLGLGMDVWTMTDVSGLISRAECEGSFYWYCFNLTGRPALAVFGVVVDAVVLCLFSWNSCAITLWASNTRYYN